MEQDNSKVAWGKALKPIFALLLVIVLWQVLVLEMLKNGIISTLIAEFNSEVLFAMNRSGLRSPVAAINTPFADNIPSSNPIGIPAPQRIKSCKETKR